MLVTLMAEVVAIVNARPIAALLSDTMRGNKSPEL